MKIPNIKAAEKYNLDENLQQLEKDSFNEGVNHDLIEAVTKSMKEQHGESIKKTYYAKKAKEEEEEAEWAKEEEGWAKGWY